MKYPSLSQLEPEQLQAIDAAKIHRKAFFRRDEITYIIDQNLRGSIVMARNQDGKEAGYIATSPHWKHYAIEVPPEFRNMWIGKTLLLTKQALDGILMFDWTNLHSHIFFLIRRGYIPVSKMMDYNTFSDLEVEELQLLIEKLKIFRMQGFQHGLPEDISPTVVQLKYSPAKAKKLIWEYGLQ
jgi:hypothetical protein